MRKIVITDAGGKPYLTRWILFKLFGLKLYLHKLHTDDADRDLHDHPWNFASIILRGGYNELGPDGQWTRYRWLNIKKATDAHRLVLLRYPTWTLLFVGRKSRDWGFHTPDGWIHHKEYLDRKFGVGNWVDSTSQYD
jgi:hypothetical protein